MIRLSMPNVSSKDTLRSQKIIISGFWGNHKEGKVKASELIGKLVDLMVRHGDKEIELGVSHVDTEIDRMFWDELKFVDTAEHKNKFRLTNV